MILTQNFKSFLSLTDEEQMNLILRNHEKRKSINLLVRKKRAKKASKKKKKTPSRIAPEVRALFESMPEELKKMF